MTDCRLSPAYELKRAAVDAAGTFSGYASTFGGAVPDSYGDFISAGAFAASLAEHKAAGSVPALLWAHNPAEPIGVWLDMREDAHGLAVKGKLTLGVGRGAEAYELMRDGALGLSIGYQIEDWNAGPKPGQRTLKAVRLFEVSAVAMPSNPNARILGVKSFSTIRDFESAARDALGLSSREAKRLAAGGYDSLMRRDDGDQSEELAELVRAIGARTAELKSITKVSR